MVGGTSSFLSHSPKKTTVNKITISAIISISISAPQESTTRLVSFAPKIIILGLTVGLPCHSYLSVGFLCKKMFISFRCN